MTEQTASKRNLLTALQQRLIQEQRIKGAGYRAIAAELGLNRDTVRNYCRTLGLDGIAQEQKDDYKNQREVVCLNCGKPLTQPHTGRRRKYCGEDCRRLWWLAHPEAIHKSEDALYNATCACCGKEFIIYGNQHRKYCSHPCYIQDRFRQSELS
jgi:endogenous inhibitor of DNA gyrase (YacG/DUF329 family)